MEIIKQIFEQLQSTSSKTGKERILNENINNFELKFVLDFLLNPFIVTGLSSKKISKTVTLEATVRLVNAADAMKYLLKNNTGTDEVIANIQGFINEQPDGMKDFYTQLFTKSIKLGCAANTVNKVFGKGFIPKFECMLAEKYFDYAGKVEGKDFTVTLKLDGIRALIIKDNDTVSIYSRQGQRIEGLVDIENEILNHFRNRFVLDGELLITETDGIPSKEQYKATTQIVRRDGEKHGITYWAFDYMELSEFEKQDCPTFYQNRRERLEHDFDDDLQYIKVLPALYTGNDTSKIIETLNKVRSDGEEGCMINTNDSPYEFKRSQSILKVKVMQDCDLQIVGFEEGQGRLAGTLGRINVDYKGNVLGVGGGFTDEQRHYIWSNTEALLGRVIKVRYFEETQDKDGNLSLRFPVFDSLREEEKEVSYA